MPNMNMQLVLVGALACKTVTLNKYKFIGGSLNIEGPEEDCMNLARFMARSYNAHPVGPALEAARAEYLRCLEITPKTKRPIEVTISVAEYERLKKEAAYGRHQQATAAAGPEPVPAVHGDVSADGRTSEGETDDGGPDAEAGEGDAGGDPKVPDGEGAEADLLRKAVMVLDPDDETHWTDAGLPAMRAVEEAYGSTDITRADVEAVAPGWKRDRAHKAKEVIG